jgi:hypothetical protein
LQCKNSQFLDYVAGLCQKQSLKQTFTVREKTLIHFTTKHGTITNLLEIYLREPFVDQAPIKDIIGGRAGPKYIRESDNGTDLNP